MNADERLEVVIPHLANSLRLDAYRVNFAHEFLASGQRVSMRGMASYRDGALRIQTTFEQGSTPQDLTIVRDVKDVHWIERRTENQPPDVYRTDMAEYSRLIASDPDAMRAFRDGLNFQPLPQSWYAWLEDMEARYEGSTKVDGWDTHVISGSQSPGLMEEIDPEGRLRRAGSLPMTTRVFATIRHAFPLRTEFKSRDGSVSGVMEFTNFDPAPVPRRDEFVYKPPADARLVNIEEKVESPPLKDATPDTVQRATSQRPPIIDSSPATRPKSEEKRKPRGGLFEY